MGLLNNKRIPVIFAFFLIVLLLSVHIFFEQREYNAKVSELDKELNEYYNSYLHLVQQKQFKYLIKKHNISSPSTVIITSNKSPTNTFQSINKYCFNMSSCDNITEGIGIYDESEANTSVYILPRSTDQDVKNANVLRNIDADINMSLQVYKDINNVHYDLVSLIEQYKDHIERVNKSERLAVNLVSLSNTLQAQVTYLIQTIDILETLDKDNLEDITTEDVIKQVKKKDTLDTPRTYFSYPSHTTNRKYSWNRRYLPHSVIWQVKEIIPLDVAIHIDTLEIIPLNQVSYEAKTLHDKIVRNPKQNESLESLYIRNILKENISLNYVRHLDFKMVKFTRDYPW